MSIRHLHTEIDLGERGSNVRFSFTALSTLNSHCILVPQNTIVIFLRRIVANQHGSEGDRIPSETSRQNQGLSVVARPRPNQDPNRTGLWLGSRDRFSNAYCYPSSV